MSQINNKNNDEIEINLSELINVILSKWMLIVIISIFFGILAYAYSTLVIVPQYQSTTKIYVIKQENSDTITYSDLQTGSQLTSDYVVMVESRSVLEQVINSMSLSLTYEQLLSKVSVETPTNTRIIAITVTDKDPYQAKKIADEIRVAASDQISKVMAIDAVNVVEEGNIPQRPSSPNVKKITAVGVVAGFLLSSIFVIVTFLLNDSIKTPEDIEKYLGLSTLGTIPLDEELDLQEKNNQKLKKKAMRDKKKKNSSKAKTSENESELHLEDII